MVYSAVSHPACPGAAGCPASHGAASHPTYHRAASHFACHGAASHFACHGAASHPKCHGAACHRTWHGAASPSRDGRTTHRQVMDPELDSDFGMFYEDATSKVAGRTVRVRTESQARTHMHTRTHE